MSMNSRSFGPDGPQDDKRLQDDNGPKDDNITRDGQIGCPALLLLTIMTATSKTQTKSDQPVSQWPAGHINLPTPASKSGYSQPNRPLKALQGILSCS